jgi:hypothetical protein
MPTPPEPKRNADITSLVPYVADRVEKILARMKARGFDPIVFEALRTKARQEWLYGVGRTHSLKRKPITWTLKSRHLAGKAVDIISKKRGWNWPEFYTALREEARREGMYALDVEQCHIEFRG